MRYSQAMLGHDIIVIGASAGGMQAIEELCAKLPRDLPASLFIVWHIASDSIGMLPEILNRVSPLPASNARDGEDIRRGHIYIAPPDRHLLLMPRGIRVIDGPRENRCRPAIDPLFRTAANRSDRASSA